jgi:hypothetical protein
MVCRSQIFPLDPLRQKPYGNLRLYSSQVKILSLPHSVRTSSKPPLTLRTVSQMFSEMFPQITLHLIPRKTGTQVSEPAFVQHFQRPIARPSTKLVNGTISLNPPRQTMRLASRQCIPMRRCSKWSSLHPILQLHGCRQILYRVTLRYHH